MISPPSRTGSCGQYEWLVTEHDLPEFLQLCPDALLGKHIAVTANDSGAMILRSSEIAAGWTESGGIAYSPRLTHLDGLPLSRCGGFDEWYIFNAPTRLGIISTRNVLECPPEPGKITAFVNYYDFLLLDEPSLADLFWRQLALIRPESYLADTDRHLTFVTRDRELYSRAMQILGGAPLDVRPRATT